MGKVRAIGAAAAVVCSCVPGARAPDAPLRDKMQLPSGPEARPVPESGPLRVVFATPRGPTDQRTEISLVFSKPVNPLGDPTDRVDAPARITPSVEGSWQWLGSSALRFNAKSPMPLATSFQVEIPAGFAALDGSKLTEPFSWSFSTPKPELKACRPEDGAEGLVPDTTFTLTFNQRIDQREVERAVTLLAGQDRIAFSAVESGGVIELQPESPLPVGQPVVLKVAEDLRGVEGELPMGEARTLRFETIGPLTGAFRCTPHPHEPGACLPGEPVLLELSHDASIEDVVRRIRVVPRPAGLEVGPDGGWEKDRRFVLHGDFVPDTTYRLRLAAGTGRHRLRDDAGQPLERDVTAALRLGHLQPSAHFTARGIYWSRKVPHRLPLRMLNVNDVEVRAVALSQPDVIRRLEDPDAPVSFGDALEMEAGPIDDEKRADVDIDAFLPKDAAGPVIVRGSHVPMHGKAREHFDYELQLTDLALLTRAGGNEGLVWVTTLDKEAPVPGTSLQMWGIPAAGKGRAVRLATAASDVGGLAAFTLNRGSGRFERLAVVARKGDDWTYQTLSLPPSPRPVGFVFDERGIYRPGERVMVSGAFRVPDGRGLSTPAGERVELEARRPDGEVLRSWTARLSSFGSFSSALRLPSSAPLGRYELSAKLREATVRDAFLVDEYVPLEHTVQVRTDRGAYRRGERMTCEVRGAYLHGGSMHGAEARLVVSRSQASYAIPDLPDYTVVDAEASVPRRRIVAREVELDAKGGYSLPVDLSMPGQQTPEQVWCEAAVSDLNRRTVANGDGALVHPGDLYVALERKDYDPVEPGEKLEVRTLVVTPEGERRSRPVHVELVHRRGVEGEDDQEQTIGRCDVTPGREPATCRFVVPKVEPKPRDVVVVRASTTDDGGRKVRAAYVRAVERPYRPVKAPPPTPVAPAPPPPPRLEIEPDDHEYALGEVARLRISSPYDKPAEALLTVEREGILEHRRLRLPPHGSGPTRVDLRVTEAWIPDVVVSVTALAGRESERTRTRLAVKLEPRVLAVDVSPERRIAEPGASLDVEVRLRDYRGRPVRGEVTLWAADEGSLQLVGYRLPDPVYAMYERYGHWIEHADSRDAVLQTHWFGSRRARPPSVRMGATSVQRTRTDFRQTAFFAPNLRTDASGRVRHRVKLPDGLTRYRFMAVALSGDELFGTGQAHVETNKALMARPMLPRVIRVGDTFEVPVVVSTKDLPPTEVAVDVRATGLAAAGPGTSRMRLQPARPEEVRATFRAERPGPVRLRVSAEAVGGKAGDAVELEGKVVTPLVLETATLRGATSGPVAEQLASLASVRPDAGSLTVSMAATPLVGLEEAFAQLEQYPYGCTEQRMSQVLPAMTAERLATAMGRGPTKGHRGYAGQIRKLASSQNEDGGFGFWPGSRRSEPWLTAYVVWGLVEAKRRGVAVPREVLERGLTYLTSRTMPAPGDRGETAELAVQAFTVDILAAQGKQLEARARALFERRRRLPLFARALLLHALALDGKNRGNSRWVETSRQLLRELEQAVRLDGPTASVVTQSWDLDPAFLDTSTRTTAMMLRALVAAEPRHPLVDPLALGLLAERRHGRFRTTHDAAWALVALGAYHDTRDSGRGAFSSRLFLGDDLIASHRFEPATWGRAYRVKLPMNRLAAAGSRPLTFDVEGGELHYETTLRFARRQLPEQPVEAGFFVRKTLRPIATFGTTGPVAPPRGDVSVRAGQVVLCEVEVVTPTPRTFVVVDDPLPGGFEAIDFSLSRAGNWLSVVPRGDAATAREMRDDRVVHFADDLPAGITTYRYLARATVPGRFLMPPTRAEEMYTPETYGMTKARWVRVTPR